MKKLTGQRNRILAIALAILIALTIFPGVALAYDAEVATVEDYEIHLAYMLGDRDGNFRPLENATRAEVAAILVRVQLFGGTLSTGASAMFIDVRSGDWFSPYVALAYQMGLVTGDPADEQGNRTFRPHDPITREEFAAILARTADGLYTGTPSFADADQISNWARNYVYTVYHAGWMVGDGGLFRPGARINRAELATAMNRVLGRVYSAAAIANADVENLQYARDFNDVSPNDWFFASVMGAANDHRLSRDDDGMVVWMDIMS